MFKVVCIESGKGVGNQSLRGEIYTVVEIGWVQGETYFLKEITNGSKYWDGKYNWWGHDPARFRKVDETFSTETLAEIAEQIESEQLIPST